MGIAVDGIKENAKSEVLARLVHADLPGTSCVIRMHEMNKLSFFIRRAEGADTPAGSATVRQAGAPRYSNGSTVPRPIACLFPM
jgi:hypothetical protein